MKIRPLHEHVLVKIREAETRTASGLFIPDVAKEKSGEADVVAVGNGRVLKSGEVRPLDVKPGDRVLYLKRPAFENIGQRLEARVLGDGYLLLREDDIFAVIEA